MVRALQLIGAVAETDCRARDCGVELVMLGVLIMRLLCPFGNAPDVPNEYAILLN